MSEEKERQEFTKWWLIMVGLILLTMVIFGAFKFATKPARLLDRVTNVDHIISSYEEFQNTYNTCLQKCNQIYILSQLPDGDKSGGFTKQDRIIAEQNQLARWVEEYNAKSKQITRNNWKSPELPYQLNFKTICDEN